jgi:hypothetical protein
LTWTRPDPIRVKKIKPISNSFIFGSYRIELGSNQIGSIIDTSSSVSIHFLVRSSIIHTDSNIASIWCEICLLPGSKLSCSLKLNKLNVTIIISFVAIHWDIIVPSTQYLNADVFSKKNVRTINVDSRNKSIWMLPWQNHLGQAYSCACS